MTLCVIIGESCSVIRVYVPVSMQKELMCVHVCLHMHVGVCEMERLVHTVLACVNLQYSCTVYLRV